MSYPHIKPHLVGITFTRPELRDKAEQLAGKLCLPLASADLDHDFILTCSNNGLELRYTKDPSLTGSCRVDFVGGQAGFRRRHGGSEMLVRAIGCKHNSPTYVLDATGGMGRDAFVMASHGCHVHIIERHPVIAALLEDGLQRATQQPDTKKIVERIMMTTGDSFHFLRKKPEKQYDVIYLDPMFPARSKSSRVKKELQMLQMLAGHGNDTKNLFTAALQAAGNRVVVKRPKAASSLPGLSPSYSLSSKKIRFDVYRLTEPGPKMKRTDRQPVATPD